MSLISSARVLKLGVNIDHVATLRQARYSATPDSHQAEPSLVAAAHEAEAAGADSITVHLREDRRHIQDRDVYELKEKIHTLLNLEMGNSPDILSVALDVRPAFACLVPEQRREVTTEGGLDVINAGPELERTIRSLQENGTKVSLFIDPDLAQVREAARLKADMIELHTGAFANAAPQGGARELEGLKAAAVAAHESGLQVNAGHGITISNLATLMQVPHLTELNVGHHLVSRAVYLGLSRVIRDFIATMEAYPLLRDDRLT